MRSATSDAHLADELLETLAPILARQRRRWAERCQAHGLSVVGFHALALLEEQGPTPMTRLADEMDVALPNATGIIGRLADRGLVERSADPDDRRVVRAGLSSAGRRLLAEMETARSDRLRRLVDRLRPDQQRRVLEALRDVTAAAHALAAEEENR